MSFYLPGLSDIEEEGAEMTEDAKYTCMFCGSKTSGDDGFIYCPYCGEPYDAEGYVIDRPLPCVRDEHGAIKEQTVKQLFAKIDEELDELKAAVLSVFYGLNVVPSDRPDLKNIGDDEMPLIASEAADTITAITTMLEALGIDAKMRDEAQRRVNNRNRERGRL